MTWSYLKPVRLALSVLAVWSFMALNAPVPAGPPTTAEGYAAAKAKALGPTEQEFARILAAHPKDAALVDLRARLTAVDKTAEMILRRLESIRAASVDKLLDGLPSLPNPRGGPGATMGAAEIVTGAKPSILLTFTNRQKS